MSLAGARPAAMPGSWPTCQDAQEALGTIGSQITSLQTLPERAQASIEPRLSSTARRSAPASIPGTG